MPDGSINPYIQRKFLDVVVGQELMTSLLNWRHTEYLNLPVFEGIPVDAKIVGVDYQFDLDAFRVRFCHESFDPVTPGHPIPVTNEIHYSTVKVRCSRVFDEGVNRWYCITCGNIEDQCSC